MEKYAKLSQDDMTLLANEAEKFLTLHRNNLAYIYAPKIIIPSDGFVIKSLKSFTIDKNSIVLTQGNLNAGKFTFCGKGDVVHDEPASRIPMSKSMRFSGNAWVKTIDERTFVTQLNITSLS